MTDQEVAVEVSSAKKVKVATVVVAEIGSLVRSAMEIAPQVPAVRTIPDPVQAQEVVLQPKAILKALRVTVEARLA